MFNYKYTLLAAFFCLFIISSCDSPKKLPQDTNEEIVFQSSFNGEKLHCNSVISHSIKKWRYTQLQFFISTIELKNDKGVWQKASLMKSAYQTSKSALLGENCNLSNTQNKANWILKFDGKTDLANSSHIRFDLGLPFTVNHLNPLTQDSPLNIPTMFWGWQKGHKFLRLEMVADDDDWLFHLGSVGCKAASPLRTPQQECLYPNRYTFELPINTENNQIDLNLSTLLNNITIAEQASCQSSPDKASCQTLFSNLREKNEQSVFQTNKKDVINE